MEHAERKRERWSGECEGEHVVSDVADAILADRCCRYRVCTGAYLGDEKEDGTARQGKTRQKEGADKKITRGGCRRDAAWVYNETQVGVGCRLGGGDGGIA